MVRTFVALAAFLARAADGVHSRPPVSNTSTTHKLVATSLREEDNAYHYMPEERVLTCACAKCGSTSVYMFLYNQTFGKEWTYDDAPWVQEVDSARWQGKFETVPDEQTREIITNAEVFSFALMRDPKERIISSWKSKAACGEEFATDTDDRAILVPQLMELAGLQQAECLELEQFVNALAVVHRMGKAQMLNEHFRPQQYSCFRDFGPAMWTQVADVSEAGAAHRLAMHFGHADATDFPQEHGSPSHPVPITDTANRLLEEITREEYEVLATRRV